MLLGELIKSLSSKAGIKEDDETLKKILSFSDASQFDVPDEFSNSLEQNLLTVESAIANPSVRSPLFAEFNGSIDRELNRIPADFEFDEVAKGEVLGVEKDTKGKLKKVLEHLKRVNTELKEKANKPGAKTDENAKAEIQALKNQIENLNREAENLKGSYQSQINTLQENNQSDKKKYALRTFLAGRPLPKNGLSPEVNIMTAELLINQEAAKNGLQFHLDEFGNLILKQRKDGADIDFFVNNKKVVAPEFIDGVLAQNKFVQVNDPKQPPIGQGNNTPAPITPGVPTNSALADESRQVLESFMGQTV